MTKNRKMIFNLTFLIVFVCSNTQDCILKMKTDFPDKEPVLFQKTSNGYELIQPRVDSIILSYLENVIISCPGIKNTITKINANFATAQCKGGKDLSVLNNKYQFKALDCSSRVTGEVDLSPTICGGTRNGLIIGVGHYINKQFVSLFQVCYDNQKGESLYAQHTIYGSSINSAKTCTRPTFKVKGLAPGIDAQKDYEQINQLTRFTDILGSSQLASQYIKNKVSYLAKGHLAPDADFILGSSKCSSYFYINSVPQWQTINNGNWKSMETAVRKLAVREESNFIVITGGHDTLSLENKYIYLDKTNKLPVPKFVWKIVYSLNTKEAIAFISLNNPFVEIITKADYLCLNICHANRWGTPNWIIPSKGLLYCCTVHDLKQVIPTIPDIAAIGILQG